MIPDPNIDQRRAADPVASVVVAASAGSGKTKVLTDRVLRLLLSGTDPTRILCLTYTRAAAAEMAGRLAARLRGWATMADGALDQDLFALTGADAHAAMLGRARSLFAQVLDAPGGLKIETLHGFCQSVLRRFPLEAGISPSFESLDEDQARALMAECQARLLADPGGLGGDIETLALNLGTVGFEAALADVIARRADLDAALGTLGTEDAVATVISGLMGVDPQATEDNLRDAAARDGAFDRAGLARVGAVMAEAKAKTDRARGAALLAWLEAGPTHRAAGLDAHGALFLTQKGAVRDRLATKATLDALPDAGEILAAEAGRLEGLDLARAAVATRDLTTALIRIARRLLGDYAAAKTRLARLDYDDLIERTGRLLNRAGAAWVHYKLDGGIDHVLVDEAQDTSPAQWRLVEALTDEFHAGLGARPGPRTEFLVGDEKQSIFSFQGADPWAFLAASDRLLARAADAGQPAHRVPMTVSFRSAPAILRLVDAVFAAQDAQDGVRLTAQAIRHQSFRPTAQGRVELWPILAPEEAEEDAPWTPPGTARRRLSRETRLARKLAQTVQGLLREGAALPATGRPIEPG